MAFAARRPAAARAAGLTNERLMQLVRFPYVRRAISSALAKAVPEKVEAGHRGSYVRFRIADPRTFHRALFATIPVGGRGTLLVIGTPLSQIRRPAELAAFLRRMGRRGLRAEARRSLIYQLRSAGIIGGARTQAVLVPRSRVLTVAGKFSGLRFSGRAAANPILATIGFNPGSRRRGKRQNPLSQAERSMITERRVEHLHRARVSRGSKAAYHRGAAHEAEHIAAQFNPGAGLVQIKLPFREGQHVTTAQIESWIASLPHGAFRRAYESRFQKAKAQYKRFHLGSLPPYWKFTAFGFGANSSITDVDFVVSEGKEWAAPYQVSPRSGKYDPKVHGRYIHAHGDSKMEIDIKRAAPTKKLPERFHTADGKFVGVIPSRNVKITDWYRG